MIILKQSYDNFKTILQSLFTLGCVFMYAKTYSISTLSITKNSDTKRCKTTLSEMILSMKTLFILKLSVVQSCSQIRDYDGNVWG